MNTQNLLLEGVIPCQMQPNGKAIVFGTMIRGSSPFIPKMCPNWLGN